MLVSKKLATNRALKLSRFFELDLTIKIFGVTILHWHYPPLRSNDHEYVEVASDYDDDFVEKPKNP